MKNRKMKSPFRWLLLIPAQLLIDVILFNLTMALEYAFIESSEREMAEQGIAIGGHPGPGVSIFGIGMILLFTKLAILAAIVMMVVGLTQRHSLKKTLKERYVRDVELDIPPGEAEQEVQLFLRRRQSPMQSGFYPAFWKGQQCFCADMFFTETGTGRKLPGKYFFAYFYEDGVLHMEAWMCVIGENGFCQKAYAAQPPYLNMLAGFEAYLAEKYQADRETGGKKKKRTFSRGTIAIIVGMALLALGAGLSTLLYPL